jgi:hypothetical protein
MTTSAINTGAINALSFPGSQDGLSLVDLVGNVIVTCSVATLSLNLTASAATTPQARCSTSTLIIKYRPSAPATGAAVVAVDAVVKARLSAFAAGAATSTPFATGIKRSSSAQSDASATGSVVAYVMATRSASAIALASANSGANKKISFGGATSGTAVASAFAVRGIRLGADNPALATTIASMSLRSGIAATTTATASATSIGRASKIATASVIGAAVPSSPVIKARLNSIADPIAALALGSVGTIKRIHVGVIGLVTSINAAIPALLARPSALTSAVAATQASLKIVNYSIPLLLQAKAATGNVQALIAIQMEAACSASANGSALAALILRTGATITASAITSSSAADYATTLPAPEERLMIVGASDRRMEVQI